MHTYIYILCVSIHCVFCLVILMSVFVARLLLKFLLSKTGEHYMVHGWMIGLGMYAICNLHNRDFSSGHMAPLPCFILSGQMCYWVYSSSKAEAQWGRCGCVSREEAEWGSYVAIDVGKSFKVGGCCSTIKEFHVHDSWMGVGMKAPPINSSVENYVLFQTVCRESFRLCSNGCWSKSYNMLVPWGTCSRGRCGTVS